MRLDFFKLRVNDTTHLLFFKWKFICQVSIFYGKLGWHQQIRIKLRWLFNCNGRKFEPYKKWKILVFLLFFIFFFPLKTGSHLPAITELLARYWHYHYDINYESPRCQNYCPKIVRKYRYWHRYRPVYIAIYRYRPIMKKPISKHPYESYNKYSGGTCLLQDRAYLLNMIGFVQNLNWVCVKFIYFGTCHEILSN